jgi:hypothetical protein
MTEIELGGQEPDALDDDRTLDSWDDLERLDDVLYVGEGDVSWYFDHPLTFKHGYANVEQVRVTTTGGFPHDLSIDDYPASDFVRVTEEAGA